MMQTGITATLMKCSVSSQTKGNSRSEPEQLLQSLMLQRKHQSLPCLPNFIELHGQHVDTCSYTLALGTALLISSSPAAASCASLPV